MKAALSRSLDLLKLAPKHELEEIRQQLKRARQNIKRVQRNNKRIKTQNQNLKQKLREKGQQYKQLTRENLLSEMPQRSVCAEIGVHEGEFSREILRIVQPKRLHLIDPWEHEEGDPDKASRVGGIKEDVSKTEGQAIMDGRYRQIEEMFGEEVREERIKIHRDYSNAVADEFEDSYFDWIYIDGNHLYEFVKEDLELYYPKVKPGGRIAGDDYGMVWQWGGGVHIAVDEFVSEKPGLILTVRGHQFVIKKQS